MAETPLTREQRLQRFADETDAINLRSQIEGPDPNCAEILADIFAEHEAACAKLEAQDAATGQTRKAR